MADSQYDTKKAEEYSRPTRLRHPQRRMSYETWLEEIGDLHGRSVIDMACGSGDSTRMLRRAGAAEVIGVDISHEMIDRAVASEKTAPQGITYVQHDCAKPLLITKADIATAAYLFNYAASLEDLRGMSNMLALNLKPGGRLICIANNPTYPISELTHPHQSSSGEWLDGPWGDGSRFRTHLYNLDGTEITSLESHYWTRETLEQVLQSANFTHIEWVPLRMTEEGKKLLPNWRDLERETHSIILKATLDRAGV